MYNQLEALITISEERSLSALQTSYFASGPPVAYMLNLVSKAFSLHVGRSAKCLWHRLVGFIL